MNESFMIDVKGDPLNLTYGTPNRSNIPLYRRTGFGSILGFNRRIKIDRSESHDKRVVLHTPSSDSSRKVTKWSKRDLPTRKTKLVAPSLPIRPFDYGASFVHLGSGKEQETENAEVDYRNISRKSDHDGDLNSDLENASDSDTVPVFDDPNDLAIRTQNVDLARLCKEEPRNLGNWLKFIDYQDKMIKLGTREKSIDLNNAERRSLAEVKMSIYKDALAKTKDDRYAQETLWLGLLYEGTKVWDGQSQHKKWDQAVQNNPKSVNLLVGRLNAIQCDSSTFRYGMCSL
jgi:hypothetical protein